MGHPASGLAVNGGAGVSAPPPAAAREARVEGDKWGLFGRRLIMMLAALSLVLGLGLTALFVAQSTRQLRNTLKAQGESLAQSAGFAAFVPLELEDETALKVLVGSVALNKDVASVRVLDSGGRIRAEFIRPGKVFGPRAALSSPVRSRQGGKTIGLIEVKMTDEMVIRHRNHLLAASFAFNGILVTLIAVVGALMIRHMTLRMRDLVNEAYWIEELRRSNKELEEFAYIASHDLQAPLRKISGFAQLLGEHLAGQLDAQARSYIGTLNEGCRRMQALIQALLEYSRAGTQPLAKELVDTAELARRAWEDLEVPARESGANISIEDLPQLTADPQQLTIVFRNLFSNGIKFRGNRKPEIRVSAQRSASHWRFCVKDNGIGIAPRYAEQIFEMFRRLHRQEEYPGTGIGLALVRKFVSRHGGRIWVESKPENGSAFYFTIEANFKGANQ